MGIKYAIILILCMFTSHNLIQGSLATDKDEKVVEQSICLIDKDTEYCSKEWLSDFIQHTKEKGSQQQRLISGDGFTCSNIRFVKNTVRLTVGYGLLNKNKKQAIPKLSLNQTIYEKLTKLGSAIKIINGYVQNLDESEDKSFTPPKINVYLPHISYIIQWDPSSLPELVPGGMIEDENEHSCVFLSGKGEDETNSAIEQFYNDIYKEEQDPSIVIYSGSKVADAFVPHIIFDAVVTNKYPIFQEPYLAALANDMMSKYPFTKDTKDKVLEVKNRINLTFRFLHHILANDFTYLYNNRSDTVRLLISNFMKDLGINIEEESDNKYQEKSFNKVLVENKKIFINAALDRLNQESNSLKEKESSVLKNIILYIKYCLHPDCLKEPKYRKKFWRAIKELGNTITCKNPDSPNGNLISIAQRVVKYALSGFNGSHTEPLFIKFIRTNPLLLTQHLQSVIGQNKDKISCNAKPNFLGIIVDGYSWLDTCKSCGVYLNSNDLWVESLAEMRDNKVLKSFNIPFPHLDSMFRMVSQEPYDDMPSDLSGSEGGSDYTKTGWDYRTLSEGRYTLATRVSSKDKLIRDRIFERIPTSVTMAALSKPLEFWTTHSELTKVVLKPIMRPFAISTVDVLSLRFPNEKALKIKKLTSAYKLASKDKMKFLTVHEVGKQLLQEPLINNEANPQLMALLISEDFLKNTVKYTQTYFSKACIKRARYHFKMKDLEKGWQYIIDYAHLGLLSNSSNEMPIVTAESAITRVVEHWHKELNNGKKFFGYETPSEEDKEHTQSAIRTFWKLLHKGTYMLDENDKMVKCLSTTLGKAKLQLPQGIKDDTATEESSSD